LTHRNTQISLSLFLFLKGNALVKNGEIMISTKKTGMFLSIILTLIVLTSFINGAQAQFLIITLYSEKQEYFLNEQIKLFGNLTHKGEKVYDGIVAIEVLNPQNKTLTIRTISTGTVSQDNYVVKITQFYSSDSDGKPRTTPYQTGTFAYFTAYIQNIDLIEHNLYFAVNIYDKLGKPWAVSSSVGLIHPSQTMLVILGYPIPYGFPSGTAVAYAVALTDKPQNNGVPHCPEAAATFQVATSTVTQIITSSYQNGEYYLNFSMPTDSKPGDYTVYATSIYQYSTAPTKKITFTIKVPDINNDGFVDVYDLIIVSSAFGSTPGEPNWNPIADINGDNAVDIYDVIIIASNFGWEA
jgi:hypothetical protein